MSYSILEAFINVETWKEELRRSIPDVLKSFMEKGLVLTDRINGKARGQWELFCGFVIKAEGVMVTTLGERHIGLVTTEVGSRSGSTNVDSTGDVEELSEKFPLALLLFYSQRALDDGRISDTDVLKYFSGYQDIYEMRQHLGELVGEIYHAKVNRKVTQRNTDVKQQDPRCVALVESCEGGKTDHNSMTLSEFHQRSKGPNARGAKSRLIKLAITSGVTMVLTAACALTTVATPTQVEATTLPVIQSTLEAGKSTETIVVPGTRTAVSSAAASVIPVETLVKEEQESYYAKILVSADQYLNEQGEFEKEKMSEVLFATLGDGPEFNETGVMLAYKETVQVQNILIDGLIVGDNAYFIFGVEDVNHKRFLYIGVFSLSYFKWIALIDQHVQGLVFDTSHTTDVEINSTVESIQKFIDDHRGKAVISTVLRSEYAPESVEKMPEQVMPLLEMGYSTIPRTNQLLNRMNKVSTNVRDLSFSDGIGSDEGLFTTENPLTMDVLTNLSFDPNSMVMVWQQVTKK